MELMEAWSKSLADKTNEFEVEVNGIKLHQGMNTITSTEGTFRIHMNSKSSGAFVKIDKESKFHKKGELARYTFKTKELKYHIGEKIPFVTESGEMQFLINEDNADIMGLMPMCVDPQPYIDNYKKIQAWKKHEEDMDENSSLHKHMLEEMKKEVDDSLVFEYTPEQLNYFRDTYYDLPMWRTKYGLTPTQKEELDEMKKKQAKKDKEFAQSPADFIRQRANVKK